MASQISLGYHNLIESQRHNQAQEQETVRANNLLDTRTRDIATRDRASREAVASADRSSRERVASADRDSRYKIAAEDRYSREYVNERSLSNHRQIAALDRLSREQIAQLDRESREYINDLQLQNALDRIQKQFETNIQQTAASNLMSGDPWTTMATGMMSPAIVAGMKNNMSKEEQDKAWKRANEWLRTIELYASLGVLNQGASSIGSLMGGWGRAMGGANSGPSSRRSNYYTYSPSYVPHYSPRSYFGDSYHY